MTIKNVIVIKNKKVANVIVVDTSDNLDPKKHGGDYFIDDQQERPGMGWVYTLSAKEFTNPAPGLGVASEKITNGVRVVETN